MKPKILIVDDDVEIRKILRIILEKENYTIYEAVDGNSALEILDETFDLIILDIMMPDKDGLSTCIDIRKELMVPILFLTAKANEYDIHIGFANGCDDYLAKPFSSIELVARVSGLIRRYRIYKGKPLSSPGMIYVKDLCIDESNSRITKDNAEIHLTNLEYNILLLLAKNRQKIFTLQNIYESVWNEPYYYTVNSTIMVHIKNLRKKLDDKTNPSKYIKNVWGRGYCIEND